MRLERGINLPRTTGGAVEYMNLFAEPDDHESGVSRRTEHQNPCTSPDDSGCQRGLSAVPQVTLQTGIPRLVLLGEVMTRSGDEQEPNGKQSEECAVGD